MVPKLSLRVDTNKLAYYLRIFVVQLLNQLLPIVVCVSSEVRAIKGRSPFSLYDDDSDDDSLLETVWQQTPVLKGDTGIRSCLLMSQ